MHVDRLLLAAPDDFDVRYAINPLTETAPVDRNAARAQWRHLRDVLVESGAQVTTLPSAGAGYPDYVFAANHAFVVNRIAILSRFRKEERRGEEEITARWLQAHGYTIHRLPAAEGLYFEGEAECVWSHGFTRLWIGYGAGRTTRAGAEAVRTILRNELKDVDIQLLRVTDTRFYHLDLALRPLPNGQCLWRAGAFSPAARETLRRAFGRAALVDVPDHLTYVCNSSIAGRTLLVPRGARAWLRTHVHMPIRELNMSEIQKAGGALRCMILPLFRVV